VRSRERFGNKRNAVGDWARPGSTGSEYRLPRVWHAVHLGGDPRERAGRTGNAGVLHARTCRADDRSYASIEGTRSVRPDDGREGTFSRCPLDERSLDLKLVTAFTTCKRIGDQLCRTSAHYLINRRR